MSEEIKNYVFKTDETALEALAGRNADLETAVQFAAGEGLSTDDLAARARVDAIKERYKDRKPGEWASYPEHLTVTLPEAVTVDDITIADDAEGEGFGVPGFGIPPFSGPSPSTAYLDARLTLLEQAQTEFQERVAKTFKEAGFKF